MSPPKRWRFVGMHASQPAELPKPKPIIFTSQKLLREDPLFYSPHSKTSRLVIAFSSVPAHLLLVHIAGPFRAIPFGLPLVKPSHILHTFLK